MPQPVDVGSTLGGRYKVTAWVLASAEDDLVLDGVDQVLNRAVSILLAAPENTSQVSASAREIATGERASNVQVLDLGVSDGRTYLVTNNANAADLLDLVIERDAPYVEPFFTDTLGSEIFGMPRSREPENEEEDRYVEEPAERAPRKPLMSGRPLPRLPKFGRGAAAAGTGAMVSGAEEAAAARDLEFGEAEDAPAEAATGAATLPPPPSARPKGPRVQERGMAPATGQTPKVSRWTDTDYSEETASDDDDTAAGRMSETNHPVPDSGRRPSNFPRSAVAATAAGSGNDYSENYPDDGGYDEDEDDAPPRTNRTMGRVLVGTLLTLVLIVAVVLSVSTLGSLKDPDPLAGTDTTPTAAAPEQAPAAEAPAEEPAAPAPVPAGVSRLVPANPALDAEHDGELPQILDGNPASYWSSYEYANDTFGGYAPNLALVVELEEESAINKIDITQLNGTGGSFSVLLNDSPTLDGAVTVAETGFTGPTTSIPVPKTNGETATAQYVIVNFTQLPRLTGVQTAFPWGLRIAEIGVS
ncbi:ABC transporter substrate-binding protein [Arthrobacter sunyaminii]|uniref:ABC transporter substrate-binding protein n=1 Tax=Arthrobacter sunyaminii TaxID=2816859 RepID=UPI001A94D208|nr:ABC transporter substrate-binding protein [Arthrobacter sunyaminii]MBO0896933.1 ABC transporter substrate-binding protein [Arthrobacter sunyaminii]